MKKPFEVGDAVVWISLKGKFTGYVIEICKDPTMEFPMIVELDGGQKHPLDELEEFTLLGHHFTDKECRTLFHKEECNGEKITTGS